MRHLIRNTTLAALCAVVLGLATIASANAPSRPIDRPEGPPDPNPTMVGEPDAGNEIIVVVYQGKTLTIRFGWAHRWLIGHGSKPAQASALRPRVVGRR